VTPAPTRRPDEARDYGKFPVVDIVPVQPGANPPEGTPPLKFRELLPFGAPLETRMKHAYDAAFVADVTATLTVPVYDPLAVNGIAVDTPKPRLLPLPLGPAFTVHAADNMEPGTLFVVASGTASA
jgi:hypothetical protein